MRHRFQAQELHDQVVARGHEHHADRGEQHQGVILAVIFVLELQIADRKHDDQRRGDEENKTEKQKKRIDQQRVAEADGPAVGNPAQLPEADGAEDHAEHGHQGVEILVASLEQVIGEQDAHGKQDEHHLRQEQAAAVHLHECLERLKHLAHRLVYFFSVSGAGAGDVSVLDGIFIPGILAAANTAAAGAGYAQGVAARSAP